MSVVISRGSGHQPGTINSRLSTSPRSLRNSRISRRPSPVGAPLASAFAWHPLVGRSAPQIRIHLKVGSNSLRENRR
jgi:hypothetical protein